MEHQSLGFLKIFFIFFKLGLTSFGGPVAHLGYFRREFVEKRKFLTESEYTELVALCQFLPGPASSQVGLSIGLLRGGYAGALAAWLGFTLPSVMIMLAAAIGFNFLSNHLSQGLVLGLKIAGASVVIHAVYMMASQLCPDYKRKLLALVSAIICLYTNNTYSHILVIIFGALVGVSLLKSAPVVEFSQLRSPISKKSAYTWFSAFAVFLFTLPLLQHFTHYEIFKVMNTYYQAGSLVFGGGHVVLPLLQQTTVEMLPDSQQNFMAGYGLAQALPGPLFSFAAYSGAIIKTNTLEALIYGGLAVVFIFLPSFFLVFSGLTFWQYLKQNSNSQAALMGINACVVGLLLAALANPVLTESAIHLSSAALLCTSVLILLLLKISPFWVVLVCAGIGLISF